MAGVNWLGDVAVPLGVLIISTVFALWLASVNRGQARQDLIFQRDARYSDEFLLATEHVWSWDLVGEYSGARLARLNQEWVRFTSFASGRADLSLAGYLSSMDQLLSAAQRRARAELDRLQAERTVLPMSLTRAEIQALFPSDERTEIDRALDNMRDMVRDWPYAERRRSCLVKINTWQFTNWENGPSDLKLAIDRQLLVSLPARVLPVRAWRRINVRVRRFADDYRYGRLPDLWKAHRMMRAEHRLMKPKNRAWKRAQKQEKRDAIEQRKRYEAAERYRNSVGEPPA